MLSFLDREVSVARPGFSRWLVPPAALSIHLAIGQVYSFSIFKNPLLALKGADGAVWNLKEVGYIFSIAIAVLGLSAALFGRWLETAGPRKAMFVAATCFGSGFLVAAAGAATHSLVLIYLGYGVIGGVGLGLGYISPVSTLIKWFPDRPGLATGLAIMGFGGGAMIGSPLGTKLMMFYRASAHPIAATWVTMGLLYFVFMMFGVFTIRVPGEGWKPEGWVPRATRSALISTQRVEVNAASRTPQFWLLWLILCMNVTAGIGILEQASPMIQDLFRGHVSAIAAAGFVGLLSLFNMGGRFVWASMSDFIGRKTTYFVFFVVGMLLYLALPITGNTHLELRPAFCADCGRADQHVRRRIRDHSGLSQGPFRQLSRERHPWTAADGVVHRRHRGAAYRQRRARPLRRQPLAETAGLPGDPAHHGWAYGGWFYRQSPGASSGKEVLAGEREQPGSSSTLSRAGTGGASIHGHK